MMVADTAAPGLDVVTVRLFDDSVTQVEEGTILWQAQLGLRLLEGDRAGIALSGLWIEGRENGRMRLAFSAAVANAFQSAGYGGYLMKTSS